MEIQISQSDIVAAAAAASTQIFVRLSYPTGQFKILHSEPTKSEPKLNRIFGQVRGGKSGLLLEELLAGFNKSNLEIALNRLCELEQVTHFQQAIIIILVGNFNSDSDKQSSSGV